MKKYLSILLIITFFGMSKAQVIPDNIKYKKANEIINSNAKNIILNQLLKTKNDYSLYNPMLIVGPGLWNRIKDFPKTSQIEKGNVTIRIPIFDSHGKINDRKEMKAKMIQDKNDFIPIWDFIIDIQNNKESVIRKLTTNEIIYYWNIINFDIEEPLFIIECNDTSKILINLNQDNKIIWLDQIVTW